MNIAIIVFYVVIIGAMMYFMAIKPQKKEQKRIIMLFGKQVIMLPVMLLDIRFFISIVVRQRKFHTLTLQHVIGSKIVDKIIERFIRSVCYN